MDQVVTLKTDITKPHVQRLDAQARDRNMPLNVYVQRVLQSTADPQMQVPNSLARQTASLAVSVMGLAREIGECRKAYEQCDGNNPNLLRTLTTLTAKASSALDEIADNQRRIA